MKASRGKPCLDIVSAAIARFEVFVASPGALLSPRWILGWALLLFMCAANLASAWLMAVPPIWQALHDIIFLFDGGWRVYNGQVPHQDFYSCFGPVPLGVLGLSFELTGGHSPQMALSLGLVGCVLACCTYVAAQGRLSRIWGVLFSFFILMLVTAPAALGMKHHEFPSFRFSTTYSEFYNRLGWAGIIIGQFCILFPRRKPHEHWLQNEILDGAVAGLGCAFAAFTKINFLILAVLMTGIALWQPRPTGRRQFVLGLALGTVFTTLLLGVWPGGVLAYFTDTLTLVRVQHPSLSLQNVYFHILGDTFWIVLLSGLTLSILARSHKREKPLRHDATRLAAIFFFITGTGCFLTLFNTEGAPFPSLFLAGLALLQMAGLLVGSSGAPSASDSADAYWRVLTVKLAVASLLATLLFFDAGSMMYSHLWLSKHPDWPKHAEALAGPLMNSFPIPVHPGENSPPVKDNEHILKSATLASNRDIVRWANDGTELLLRHIRPGDRIFSADWMNPFNLALNIPPARGGALLWEYRFIVNDRFHPDPDQTLKEVTLFMVPKVPWDTGQTEFMLRTYGQGLGTDFVKTDESVFWTLWARKSSRENAAAKPASTPR